MNSPPRWSTADLLVALSVVGAAGWCAYRLTTDGSWLSTVIPLALTAASAVAAAWVRRRCGGIACATPIPLWFGGAMLIACVGGAATWWFIDGPTEAATTGLAALIAAGPGALVVAGPIGVATGNRLAAPEGIRFPSLAALNAVDRVDTLVLNQAGTVTTGRLRVLSTEPVDPAHERNLRWFAGALAHAWPDEMAHALRASTGRGRLADVEIVDGRGIRGSVDRHPVRVGAPAWIGVAEPETIWSSVGVEVDGRTLGTVTVADDVRPGAAEAIGRLKKLGIEPVLVSGGSAETTQYIADAAGIDQFHSSTPPQAHRAVVQGLTDPHVVATAGDVRAGAAVRLHGSDTEDSNPHIHLDDSAIARVVSAIERGRATRRRVRRATGVAMTVSAIGVAVAITAVIGPVGAASFALAGSALVVAVATT